MTLPNHPCVLVVGGGVAGLSLAYQIQKEASLKKISIHLQLLESSSQIGGTLQTRKENGFLLELGPDCFLSEKPEAVTLAKELGLDSQLLSTKKEHRRNFIVKNSTLIPIPEGFYLLAPFNIPAFIKSPILSFPGKLRTSMDFFLPRKKNLEDESLASFVRRRLGKEMLDQIAQPLLGGIYAGDPEKLSLEATMPRFLDLEKQHRSIILGLQKFFHKRKTSISSLPQGPRYSLFLSFQEGMQSLAHALEKKIGPSSIRTQEMVTQIQSLSSSWEIKTSKGSLFKPQAICLATPTFQSAKMTQDSFPTLSSLLSEIDYASSAVLHFVYSRDQIQHPLDGMGFVVPRKENLSLMACTFTTQKFPNRGPDNFILLRVFVGGKLQESILTHENETLLSKVQKDLHSLLQISGAPHFRTLHRWPNSMPQYNVGHLQQIQKIEKQLSSIPGLFLVGSAFRGIGIPDTIRHSKQVAKQIVDFVSAKNKTSHSS